MTTVKSVKYVEEKEINDITHGAEPASPDYLDKVTFLLISC